MILMMAVTLLLLATLALLINNYIMKRKLSVAFLVMLGIYHLQLVSRTLMSVWEAYKIDALITRSAWIILPIALFVMYIVFLVVNKFAKAVNAVFISAIVYTIICLAQFANTAIPTLTLLRFRMGMGGVRIAYIVTGMRMLNSFLPVAIGVALAVHALQRKQMNANAVTTRA